MESVRLSVEDAVFAFDFWCVCGVMAASAAVTLSTCTFRALHSCSGVHHWRRGSESFTDTINKCQYNRFRHSDPVRDIVGHCERQRDVVRLTVAICFYDRQ